MDLREVLRWLFNPWIIIAATILALLLFAVTFGLVWFTRPTVPISTHATAVMTVIPAPTATIVWPTPTPLVPVTPTSPAPPPPAEGVLSVGAYVQVTGTGGAGLRLRSDPSLDGRVLFLALESEVFQVTGGPNQADNYTWWYLVAPYEEARQGWAVSNYLAPAQNP
jgi:hypothetical protein